jgi:hypothetical protein
LLNALDNFSGLRNGLRKAAEQRGDWAGIPMPLEGERLVIEPRYPNGEALALIGAPVPEEGNGEKLRNQFWSSSRRATIIVWQNPDGRIEWGPSGRGHHFDQDLKTLMCCQAWGIEQESNAVKTLGSLVNHYQFRQYMLTGMFMETSKRSAVTYVFRRLKPTVALRSREKRVEILCCLCLHPIAYYEGSWAGAMCPTDDVIAHLMLMRGDEPTFWKQSNQHPASRPEAGL